MTDLDATGTIFSNNTSKVHKGFYDAMSLAKTQETSIDLEIDYKQIPLRDIINNVNNGSYSNSTFLIVGHSLGGAIATLYAADLINRGVPKSKILVYTYGSPAVGDSNFVSSYDGNVYYHRIRNIYDPVPFSAYISTLIDTGNTPVNMLATFAIWSNTGLTAVQNLLNYILVSYPYQHIGYVRVFDNSGNDITDTYHNVSIFDSGKLLLNMSEHFMAQYISKLEKNTPINAPSNLTATALSSSNIKLTWTDNSVNEKGFYVYRWNGSIWVGIATLGANTTSYIDFNLSPNTTYYYTVESYNSYGVARFNGNNISATTQSTTSTVATTGSVDSITPVSATLFGVVNPQGIPASWYFQYGKIDNSYVKATMPSGLSAGTTNKAVTQKISGLTPNTSYYYFLVARNSAGTVYGEKKFFSTTSTVATTGSVDPNSITPVSATLFGTVNPQGISTACYFEFGTTEGLGKETSKINYGSGKSTIAVNPQRISGLTPDTLYYYRLVATNSGGKVYGEKKNFRTTSTVATTGSVDPNSITPVSATLFGTVNPQGISTACYFEFGTTEVLGKGTSKINYGSGKSTIAVNPQRISGLTPDTLYYYRLVATNSGGKVYGEKKNFRTTSTVATTGSVNSITPVSATLFGTVNPQGISTACYFEFGTTEVLGKETSKINYGSGKSTIAVNPQRISGLTPNTLYYYRLVATNSGGKVYGEKKNFRTL